MATTAFMDPTKAPTESEIAGALGPVARYWGRLTRYVEEAYDVEPAFVPATKNYGWDVKYRKGGKTLVSLTPDRGGFTALIVLGVAESERARELDLGDHVRGVFDDAKQLHDGRWLFVSVECDRDVDDIEDLLRVKRRPRGARPATTTAA